MEAQSAAAASPFATVVPFTGEAAVWPGAMMPPTRLTPSQPQYHTAVPVQKPRDLDKIVKAVLREAEFAGEAFYWSWPVKNKKTGRVEMLEGPSIGLAMAVAREWTNCAVPVEYQETLTEWVFTSHFVDLEKGFTVSRVFRKKKGKGVLKVGDEERTEDMSFQAAQSRAIRNVVCAGTPRWLLDQAMAVAKEVVIRKLTPEKLAAAREAAVQFLGTYGIQATQIEALLGIPGGQWGVQEIVILRGMMSQLKDGQATAEQLFPPEAAAAAPPPKASKGKRGRPAKAAPEGPPAPPSSAPPRAATPEQLEAIRLECLEKGIDIELILQQWQVSQLEELDADNACQVREWLAGQ